VQAPVQKEPISISAESSFLKSTLEPLHASVRKLAS
jgi:hypothetical protein